MVMSPRQWLDQYAPIVMTWVLCLASIGGCAAGQEPLAIGFVCDADNDLYRVVTGSLDREVKRFDHPADAIKAATPGSVVFVLADEYPKQTQTVGGKDLQAAATKGVRFYIEFPADKTAGVRLEQPKLNSLKRLVVPSGDSFEHLDTATILDPHECAYVPLAGKVKAEDVRLLLAKVAGYNKAVYGYTEGADPEPALFHHTDPQSGAKCLIATTALSHFVRGRFAPNKHWELLWEDLLSELLPGEKDIDLSWMPLTYPAYPREARLPRRARKDSIRRGIDWFANAGQLVHPAWLDTYEKNSGSYEPVVIHQPGMPYGSPVGDGSLGILEGTVNPLYPDGTQAIRWHVRGDDVGVAAMAYALHGKLEEDKQSRKIAAKLVAYLNDSPLSSGAKSDPKSNVYGLRAWNATTGSQVFYSDDIARLQLGEIGAAAALGTDKWDAELATQILGMFRLTGTNGFWAKDRYDGDMPGIDWRDLYNAAPAPAARVHPHFEAYKLACYLWLYDATGYEPLLDRSRQALGHMVKALKNGSLRWTNGIQQERARLILPLAWLVRVDGTQQHRDWLRYAVDELLAHQQPSGAIAEQVGGANGYYPPPSSNAAFGTNEAPIIQENGDPATDLLYTTNFAFKGLIEAEAVLDDAALTKAVDRLSDFMVRVQVRSEMPELDGQWLRGFDYEKWDYWGSDSDHGWGVWGNQTGWTQAEILSGLALLELDTSLWELSIERRKAKVLGTVLEEMMQGATPEENLIAHDAVNKTALFGVKPDTRYAGAGEETLTDGKVSRPSHGTGKWLGFEGEDLEVTIDLGKAIDIDSVGLGCLQQTGLGIYLPTQVEISVSADGKVFRRVAVIDHEVPHSEAGPTRVVLQKQELKAHGRYLRLRAKSLGVIPEGQQSAGAKAWLFVDELFVNPTPPTADEKAR